jgi:hypothetical protein
MRPAQVCGWKAAAGHTNSRQASAQACRMQHDCARALKFPQTCSSMLMTSDGQQTKHPGHAVTAARLVTVCCVANRSTASRQCLPCICDTYATQYRATTAQSEAYPAFHGFAVHLFQGHASSRHFRLLVPLMTCYGQRPGSQSCKQRLALGFLELTHLFALHAYLQCQRCC